MYKRPKTGGRKKGTLNKKSLELDVILAREGCEPEQVMAQIVNNTLTCGVCRGKKKTPYRLPTAPMRVCSNCKHAAKGELFTICPVCGYEPEVRTAMRKCMSCLGTRMENCSPSLRGSMAAELTQYRRAKRKAVEVSNADGEAFDVNQSITVEYIDPPKQPDEE